MKSQSLGVSLSMTTTITDYYLTSSNRQVGSTSNLFMFISLVAQLQPNVIFEVSASGLDLTSAGVSNPSSTILSASSTKLKVNCAGYVSPLTLTNVLNQVAAVYQELDSTSVDNGIRCGC